MGLSNLTLNELVPKLRLGTMRPEALLRRLLYVKEPFPILDRSSPRSPTSPQPHQFFIR